MTAHQPLLSRRAFASAICLVIGCLGASIFGLAYGTSCRAQSSTHPDFPGAILVDVYEEVPVAFATSQFLSFDGERVYDWSLWWVDEQNARASIMEYVLLDPISSLDQFSPSMAQATNAAADFLREYGTSYVRPKSGFQWARLQRSEPYSARLDLPRVELPHGPAPKGSDSGTRSITNEIWTVLTNTSQTIASVMVIDASSGRIFEEQWRSVRSDGQTNVVMTYALNEDVAPRWFLVRPGDEHRVPHARRDSPDLQRQMHAAVRQTSRIVEDRDVHSGAIGYSYVGIGAFLFPDSSTSAFRIHTLGGPNSPSARAGIEDGAFLLSVEGVDVQSVADVQEVSAMLRGPRGTPVVLEVLNPGSDAPTTVVIEREEVTISY